MTTLEALKAARALIADPSHWTQGALARNARGNRVRPWSEHAVRWCAEGASIRVCGPNFGLRGRLVGVLFGDGADAPWVVNDDQGHAAVLAMYDRAIAAEQARQEGTA